MVRVHVVVISANDTLCRGWWIPWQFLHKSNTWCVVLRDKSFGWIETAARLLRLVIARCYLIVQQPKIS